MKAFYNEIDQKCCAWLSNLMDAGLITPGVICDKSIEDIAPKSLVRFDRVHMFAGIGGWELALSLSGWRHERDGGVWTGSCPCQSFSTAGKGLGFEDERHLWPAWFHLIRECRPDVVFGEQVSAAIRHGWLDLVSADMEAEGYAIGAAVLGAHSVGAPHIRQRLYFVADAGRAGLDKQFCQHRLPQEPGNAYKGQTWRIGADRKTRLIEPSIQPLAHGIPARMVRLRGYGNAICPQTAAEFIGAWLEASQELRAA